MTNERYQKIMETKMCALYAHKLHRIHMRKMLALIDVLPKAHREAVEDALRKRIAKILKELKAEIVRESADHGLMRKQRAELMRQDGREFRFNILPSPYSQWRLILVRHPRGKTDAPISVEIGRGESITFPAGSDQNQIYTRECEGFGCQLEHELGRL